MITVQILQGSWFWSRTSFIRYINLHRCTISRRVIEWNLQIDDALSLPSTVCCVIISTYKYQPAVPLNNPYYSGRFKAFSAIDAHPGSINSHLIVYCHQRSFADLSEFGLLVAYRVILVLYDNLLDLDDWYLSSVLLRFVIVTMPNCCCYSDLICLLCPPNWLPIFCLYLRWVLLPLPQSSHCPSRLRSTLVFGTTTEQTQSGKYLRKRTVPRNQPHQRKGNWPWFGSKRYWRQKEYRLSLPPHS